MQHSKRFQKIWPWLICGLGVLFYAYEYFLRITPSVMTANLLCFYHIHYGTLGNLAAFYYYIYTPMQLAVGPLMDRYGPRRLLTLAVFCCVIGTFLFAATPILYVAELGRFFIGFGSAFAFVGVLKLATIWLPRRHFAMVAGLATTFGMLGAIFGDLALTALVNKIGWQQTSYLSAVLGIILGILIATFVRDETPFARIKAKPVSSHEAITGLCEIIKTPQMWVIGAIGGLMYVPATAFAELWAIPYLENIHGFSNEAAGLGAAMVFAGYALGSPLFGWTSDYLQRRKTLLTLSCITSAIVFIVLLFTPNLSALLVYSLLFLFGACASGEVIVFAVGREVGPKALAGSSIAFTNMAVMLSGIILQPLIGSILDIVSRGETPQGLQLFTTANYQVSLIIISVCLLLGAVLSFFVLKETYCQQKGA